MITWYIAWKIHIIVTIGIGIVSILDRICHKIFRFGSNKSPKSMKKPPPITGDVDEWLIKIFERKLSRKERKLLHDWAKYIEWEDQQKDIDRMMK